MIWRLAGNAEWRALEAENEALRGKVALLKEEVELLDGVLSAQGHIDGGRCPQVVMCVQQAQRLHLAEARLAYIDGGAPEIPGQESLL